jgi:hypothetical protein
MQRGTHDLRQEWRKVRRSKYHNLRGRNELGVDDLNLTTSSQELSAHHKENALAQW